MVDLQGEAVDGQFYAEELSTVNVNRRTNYLVF
jgi:hypothetical protein